MMALFDIDSIALSSGFNENLPILDPVILETQLGIKREAQLWCLGLYKQDLEYHIDTNGILSTLDAYRPIATSQATYNNDVETEDLPNDYSPGSPNETGFVLLPSKGPGWTSAVPDIWRWGTPRTIEAMVAIAKEWKARGGPTLVYNSISLPHGGKFPPHVSHRKGVDFDMRMIRKDGGTGSTTIYKKEYDRVRTKELIQLIKANGIATVTKIGFQDPTFVAEGLTLNWSGHDNHIHVRFAQ